MSTFPLIDLISQAKAVQSLLHGKSVEKKIEWLSAHDSIVLKPKQQQDEQQCFWFESTIKVNYCFFLDDEEFMFIGDGTTFKVSIEVCSLLNEVKFRSITMILQPKLLLNYLEDSIGTLEMLKLCTIENYSL